MKIRKLKPIMRLYKRQYFEKTGIKIKYARWSKQQLKYMELLLKPHLLEFRGVNSYDTNTIKVSEFYRK